jgi:hypothetical protein
LPTGRTLWLTSAIASSPFSSAPPIAVPRPTVRPSIAVRSALRSFVGGTTSSANPEKTTRPIRTSLGCFWTNVRVADCATASRLGSTSFEHMEPETSRARMTEVRA